MRRIPAFQVAVAVWFCLSAEGSFADWVQFRGPGGQGHAEAENLPLRWSESENVRWKTPIPGTGWSSPVVQGNQVWLTTAVENGQSLRAVCVNRNDGAVIHNVQVFAIPEPESINQKNSYASPTPILTDRRVFVHFGTNGTACLDRASGEILWRNQELKLVHKEGPGSSPALYKDRLIVPCDGMDVQFVAALSTETGDILWKTKRSGKLHDNPDFRKAYSTPLILERKDSVEAVCVGADQVIAYDVLSGAELWKVRYKGFSNVPVPVICEDLLLICTNYARPTLLAIRPGGEGDVTDTHVVWEAKRQVGAIPSAICIGGQIYMVSNRGVFTCLDPASGEALWQKRLGGNFAASPVFGDGKLYFCSETGETTVVQPPDRIISTNKLEGRVLATPAIDGESLFLRTDTHLYRIGKP